MSTKISSVSTEISEVRFLVCRFRKYWCWKRRYRSTESRWQFNEGCRMRTIATWNICACLFLFDLPVHIIGKDLDRR